MLAVFLAAGVARAQEPGPWSIGLALNAKLDWPNPLTTGLFYFPFSVRVAREWTKHLRVRGSLGYGTIFGDETSGSTLEALVAPEARGCTSLACAAARVNVGFSSSSYHWQGRTAEIRAVLIEPAFAFSLPGETRFGFGFELGWRFKLPVWRRIVAVDRVGPTEGNQTGPLLGLFLELRL